jgi:hypothetical protein
MPVQLESQGFRFWCDERSRQPLLDYYTHAAPQGWSAASTQFEVAFASRGTLVDVTNLSSVRLDGVAYNNRDGARLFSQTLPGSSLNNTLTLDTWEDGSQQHALFVFDQSAMNIVPSGAQTLQVWLIITALTVSGDQLVCGAGMMTFNDDGAFASAASPPANAGAAISLGDADARYAPIGVQFKLTNRTTGTQFLALLDGAADATATLILLPLSDATVPAITAKINAAGQLTLLNRRTGNFLPFGISGSDDAPAFVFPAPGQILLPNQSTGKLFAIAVDGADTAPYPIIVTES